jgi:hypothetical protein
MFEEDIYNSMDFEPGAIYNVYISYFLGRPDSTDINKDEKGKSWRIWAGETNDKGEPKFRKIYINTLEGVLEEEEEVQDNSGQGGAGSGAGAGGKPSGGSGTDGTGAGGKNGDAKTDEPDQKESETKPDVDEEKSDAISLQLKWGSLTMIGAMLATLH